jgi:hypothetical protein
VYRTFLYIASALLLGAGAFSGIQASGATFADTSATPFNVFSAPDWTAPDVTLVDPGYAVSGIVTVNATASDSESPISNVRIQRAPHGSGTWTTICTDDTAPYSCTWDTTPLNYGEYDLRAVATDAYTNTRTSATVMTTVQNTVGVVLDPVVGPARGTVTLTGRIVNSNGPATIAFQASTAGTNSWFDIPGCTGAAPGLVRNCTVDTSSITGAYDWRAIGVVGGVTYYDIEAGVLVDNTLPNISLTPPASPMTGTVTLNATASDAHSGVASVRFEYRKVGVTAWTTCAVDTSAPYACSLNTASLSDGTYEFRATATDVAGNVRTTGVSQATVTNGSLTLAALPIAIRSTYTLSATWNGPGSASVTFERSPTGNGSWTTICSTVVANKTATCNWDPTLNNLDSKRYYVRASATVSGKAYAHVRTTVVDKIAPTLTLTVPAAPLHGTVQLTANADDTDPDAGDESAGVADVKFEYRKGGPANPWITCGTDSSAPYACTLDTTSLAAGNYEFRATATDNAGNSTTSNMTPREVDNNPSATITSPTGGPGTTYQPGASITVSADAWALDGVTSVRFEYDSTPGPGETWATICTDFSAPYSCPWNLTTAGDLDLRAVVTSASGGTGTSKNTKVKVDSPAGAVVESSNGGTLGLPGSGDRIELTYSSLVNLNTVKPASWGGANYGTTVTMTGATGGPGNDRDFLVVNNTNLGTVYFEQDYVDAGTSAVLNATIAATTTTYNGRSVHKITITLGSVASGGANLNNVGSAQGDIRWKPSATVTDTYGNGSETKDVNETGTRDADL